MSQYECKLSDLEEEPKQENKTKVNEKKVHFNESVEKERVETPVLPSNEQRQQKSPEKDILDTLYNNRNLLFLIVIVNMFLNTSTVKENVFKILPQLMENITNYNILGTLVSGLILAVITVLFISYF